MGRLEAADLLRVHIVDKAVVLPVIRPANILPVGSCSAVCPHLGERVVGAGAERGGEEERDRGKHNRQRGSSVTGRIVNSKTRMPDLSPQTSRVGNEAPFELPYPSPIPGQATQAANSHHSLVLSMASHNLVELLP